MTHEQIKSIAEQYFIESKPDWQDENQKADTTFGFRMGYAFALKSAATPSPDVEAMAEALDACFGVMMQPSEMPPDDKHDVPYWAVHIGSIQFIEARARAEKMYYEAKKAQASQPQDAAPKAKCTKDPNTCQVAFCDWSKCLHDAQDAAQVQDGEMSVNEYYLRCTWDRTCEDRDNWRAEAKALSAIKKGLETSLTEALSSLSAAHEEIKRLRAQLDVFGTPVTKNKGGKP